MAKDPLVWTDVGELLTDYEEELREGRWRPTEGNDADVELRLERVRDVRERFEGEFA